MALRLLRKFPLLSIIRENGVQHGFSEHISLSLKAEAHISGAVTVHLARVSTSAMESCTGSLPLKSSGGVISPK